MTAEQGSPARSERWNALADQVRTALHLAGFEIGDTGTRSDRGGVHVEVDALEDSGGGVWVNWRASSALAERLVSALDAGTFDAENPDVALVGAVQRAMSLALLAVPHACGFTARTGDNDLVEEAIHVVDGPV